MASAPSQKHLSDGLSEGGEEDFWPWTEHIKWSYEYVCKCENKYGIVNNFVII